MSFFFRIFAAKLCILQMKTNQPLFSVLIANYNNGKYLMEAIESVRRQTYTNWEIILVDDASTDNSKELYKELEKDERIHIYLNEQNMGCGYTKHRCAELATGEICGFLDPDDALTNEAIEKEVYEHLRFPGVSLVFSQRYITDERLNPERITPSKETTLPIEIQNYFDAGIVSHFVSFKKELYDKTEGISANQQKSVDMDLYFKLEEVGKFYFIPEPLYYYRLGTGNNISYGKDNELWALCWEYLALISACKRRNVDLGKVACTPMQKRIKAMVELSARQAAYEKEIEIRNSKAYRVGVMILKPIKVLKKIFKR